MRRRHVQQNFSSVHWIFSPIHHFPGQNSDLKIKHLCQCYLATLPVKRRMRTCEPIATPHVSAFNLYANSSPIQESSRIVWTELGLVSEINEAPITSNYGNRATCYSRQHTAESKQLIDEKRTGSERLWDWLCINCTIQLRLAFPLCITSGQSYLLVIFCGANMFL